MKKSHGRQSHQIINSVVTAWDRVFKGKSDLVKAPIGDARMPNKSKDVKYMFLMGLGSENNG
jgi:hypothetical protein